MLRGARLIDIARATGLPATYVSQAERGERPLAGRLLRLLAGQYATPPAQLVYEMQRWLDRTQADREVHA